MVPMYLHHLELVLRQALSGRVPSNQPMDSVFQVDMTSPETRSKESKGWDHKYALENPPAPCSVKRHSQTLDPLASTLRWGLVDLGANADTPMKVEILHL
mmetsp:Transcript_32204/g.78250  ORF Transcript_32204/g.78250 Transcript_32204/m.78250 type:complete len:100 (-) Transcript_32204:117-416(-)